MSEPCCTSSQAGLLTVGHLSPSPIGNLDPVDDRGSAGEGASSAILFLRMVRCCIRLTRLTLVCEVIRYRLVQVRQNLKKKTFRVGSPQSPFSISSSFILFFVLLPFFLNTKMQKGYPELVVPSSQSWRSDLKTVYLPSLFFSLSVCFVSSSHYTFGQKYHLPYPGHVVALLV